MIQISPTYYGTRKLYCKYCGHRLTKPYDMYPGMPKMPMYDEYTGAPLEQPDVCNNPNCSRNKVWC